MKNNHRFITSSLVNIDQPQSSKICPQSTKLSSSTSALSKMMITTNTNPHPSHHSLPEVMDQYSQWRSEDRDQDENEMIVLMPFTNQVGGHTQMMLLNQQTICKPLVPRELLFYLNIPRQLIGFVPNYKGVVEISQHCDTPTIYHPSSLRDKKSSLELRVRLSSCNGKGLLMNQQESIISSRPTQQYFMLLENIASNYHLPCILDLKMGTRQHSDDASDEKRRRQMAKCAASTSGTLGVRICGMQVYHKLTNSTYGIYHQDKYHGRKIKNEHGLKAELEIYFKNRTYLIRPVVRRLKKLRARVLDTLRTTPLRFFSTSLLIVTEGCHQAHLRNRMAEPGKNMRRHHSRTYSDGSEDEHYSDCDDFQDGLHQDEDQEFDSDYDDDYFYSDDDLEDEFEHSNYTSTSPIDIINNNKDNSMDEDSSSSSSSTVSSISSITDEPSSESSTQNTRSSSPPSASKTTQHFCPNEQCPPGTRSPEFDIRLIDFAHTSFNGTQNTSSSPASGSETSSNNATNNTKPYEDYGFIMGLDNLIRLLNSILMGRRTSFTNEHKIINHNHNKRRRSSSLNNLILAQPTSLGGQQDSSINKKFNPIN